MDYLTICYGPKVPDFREVLADETIGIFIGSSFPGRIWMGKIKVTFQSLCDFLMIPKLFSIIRCNRMNLFRYRTQQLFYRTFGVYLCSSIYFVNKSKARFSFCQRDNGLFMGFTNNSTCFPVGHWIHNASFTTSNWIALKSWIQTRLYKNGIMLLI